jgi:hypothetical protein
MSNIIKFPSKDDEENVTIDVSDFDYFGFSEFSDTIFFGDITFSTFDDCNPDLVIHDYSEFATIPELDQVEIIMEQIHHEVLRNPELEEYVSAHLQRFLNHLKKS